MILIRFLLILLIVYLAVKAFLNFRNQEHVSASKPDRKDDYPPKKVSKEIGEYVDYEEVKKEKQHKTSSKS